MKAMYYKKKGNKVQCKICPRECIIAEGEAGFCKSRKNIKGELHTLVYGAPCAVNIDPIEKKPLFHFLPGSKTYSIGAIGCNLRCKYCQNWQIAQAMPADVPIIEMLPEKIISEAKVNSCASIAYTYTEPTIFYEYVLDTAKLAKKEKMKNVIVTNGFINPEPLKKLCTFIDAANVDLKGFTDEYYKKMTGAWIKPILNSMKIMKKKKVWIEITNLIVPGHNDDMKVIKKMCEWIKKNLGANTPMHFSRFYPDYLMKETEPTPIETLEKAKKVAEKAGLKYVYLGNVRTDDTTYCAKCKTKVIEREMYMVKKINLKKGKCTKGHTIPGVW